MKPSRVGNAHNPSVVGLRLCRRVRDTPAAALRDRMSTTNRNADSRLRSHRRSVLRPQWRPADTSVRTPVTGSPHRLLGRSPIEALASRCSCAACRAFRPQHCCRKPGPSPHWWPKPPKTNGVATATGSVPPGVVGQPLLASPTSALASGLLRPPLRLRGPRCFSTYTLHHRDTLSRG